MDELDDVLIDRAPTRAEVEETLAETGDEQRVMRDRYIAFTSGGSSGVRGVFVYDVRAAVGFIGPLTRGLAARIQAMDAVPPGGLSIGMVGARSAVHPTGAAQGLTAGGGLPFHYLSVPVTDGLPEIVARLNELRPPLLMGYADGPRASCAHGPGLHARRGHEHERDAHAGPARSHPRGPRRARRRHLRDDRGPHRSQRSRRRRHRPRRGHVHRRGARGPRPRHAPREPRAAAHPLRAARPVHGRLRRRAAAGPRPGSLGGRPALGRDRDPPRRHPVRGSLRVPDVLDHQVRQTALGVDVYVLATGDVDTDDLQVRIAAALADAGLDRPVVAVRSVVDLGRHPETGKLARVVPLR